MKVLLKLVSHMKFKEAGVLMYTITPQWVLLFILPCITEKRAG